MQNEVQYDLDRKAAKISALSSNNLDKYEYLIGEDLGLKPSTVEQARFEYSPLGKIFNKGLDKDDKKEGLFRRLKNIENAQKGLINGNNNNNKKKQIVQEVNQVYLVFLIVYQVKVKMKMKMKMKKLPVNFIKMELRL